MSVDIAGLRAWRTPASERTRCPDPAMAAPEEPYVGCGHDLEAFERQAGALRRVRDLADRAAGYDFDLVPEQIYAALDGTEEDS